MLRVDTGRLMSQREAGRVLVVQSVLDKRISQGEAAIQLGLSLRQVKRLCRAVREQGPSGLISRRRGAPSNRRMRSLNASAAWA